MKACDVYCCVWSVSVKGLFNVPRSLILPILLFDPHFLVGNMQRNEHVPPTTTSAPSSHVNNISWVHAAQLAVPSRHKAAHRR